jgi:hypothetical protein
MITGVFEAQLTGPDQINVRLLDVTSVTDTLPMTLRDFLHFGHFLVALRAAMNEGRLANRRIDRARLRESWEPRRDVLERKLCDTFEHSE